MGPSFVIAWLAGYVVRWWAPKFGLVDRPGHRKVHTTPTPLGGGMAIWAGVALPCAAVYFLASTVALDSLLPEPISSQLRAHRGGLLEKASSLGIFLAISAVLLLLGLLDDRFSLPWQLRLCVQSAAAASIIGLLNWRLTFFVDNLWATVPLTFLWIIWLVNSFNMLDNMDGLSGGVAAIAALFMALVLLVNPEPSGHGPQLFVGGLLLLLAGSLFGFLYHNRSPAKLFMGDAGSYFIGFTLAVCTILATFAGGAAPRHAIAAPLCVLAIPLYDTVSVLFIRWREGRSPFVGDKSHFSHRLVDLGLTKSSAVSTIYLASLGSGLGSLLLYHVNGWGALIVLAMVGCFLSVTAILEAAARNSIK